MGPAPPFPEKSVCRFQCAGYDQKPFNPLRSGIVKTGNRVLVDLMLFVLGSVRPQIGKLGRDQGARKI